MPQILIVTDSPKSDGEVVYRERIASSDLESDHFSGQLVERVGWAVSDADALEQRAAMRPRLVVDQAFRRRSRDERAGAEDQEQQAPAR
jgi:E3 ubiquitin-protein ligase DOA10